MYIYISEFYLADEIELIDCTRHILQLVNHLLSPCHCQSHIVTLLRTFCPRWQPLYPRPQRIIFIFKENTFPFFLPSLFFRIRKFNYCLFIVFPFEGAKRREKKNWKDRPNITRQTSRNTKLWKRVKRTRRRENKVTSVKPNRWDKQGNNETAD